MNRLLDGARVAIAESDVAEGAVLALPWVAGVALPWVAAGAGEAAMRVSWAIGTKVDDISCEKQIFFKMYMKWDKNKHECYSRA